VREKFGSPARTDYASPDNRNLLYGFIQSHRSCPSGRRGIEGHVFSVHLGRDWTELPCLGRLERIVVGITPSEARNISADEYGTASSPRDAI
jgi:hypothetical protein